MDSIKYDMAKFRRVYRQCTHAQRLQMIVEIQHTLEWLPPDERLAFDGAIREIQDYDRLVLN